MIPNDDSFCELDPVVKDKWGISASIFQGWIDHAVAIDSIDFDTIIDLHKKGHR